MCVNCGMSCTLGNEFPRIVIIITSLLEEKGDGGWVTFSYADIMNQLIADAQESVRSVLAWALQAQH
jgi:hypothetical protein